MSHQISNRRKRLIDKAARWVVTTGGAAIIVWLAAIFVFIFIEVYPLFGKPETGEIHSFKVDEIITPLNPPLEKGGRGDFRPAVIGMDEYHESSYIIGDDGRVFFFSPKNPLSPPFYPPVSSPSTGSGGGIIRLSKLDAPSKITSVSRSGDNRMIAFGTSDGGVLSVKVKYKIGYDSNNKRIIEPEIEENNLIQITTEKLPIKLLAFTEKESDIAAAAYTEDGRLLWYGRKSTESLLGGVKTEDFHADLSFSVTDKITSIVIDGFLENLYAGDESGNIYHFDIREKSSPKLINTVKASSSPITALSFLLGDVSLVVGDGQGGINIWFRVRDDTAETGWRLKKIHTIPPPPPIY